MACLQPLYVLATLIACGSAQQCRSGWHYGNEMGSCYAIPSGAEGNWAEAMGYCAAMNSELAIVESRSEQNFLVQLINRTLGSYNHDRDFWIGALDILEEGVFVWANRLTQVENYFWAPGEPNNENSIQGCIRLESELQWAWGDGDCTSSEYFICEREVE